MARLLFAACMSVASALDGALTGFRSGWRMHPELQRMVEKTKRRGRLRVVKGGAA